MYFLAIIQNAGFENQSQALYAYDTIDDALSAYHLELAYRGETRYKTACAIIDSNGFTVYHDSWEKRQDTE